MSKKFRPAYGMKNRHIQTLYASLFRKNPKPDTTRERLTLDDGDFLDLDWCYTNKTETNAPIVILFHGLTGSVESPYIRGIMQTLSKNGYNSVLMHFRSCSGEMNNLPRSYHSGETGDALFCINMIKKRFSKSDLYAVGYSLGGNMLLKLLGELKNSSPLKSAISISAPMQLDICADVINNGFSRIYQKHLMNNLKSNLKEKYTKHDMQTLIGLKEKEIKNLKTFWDFDGVYTAPVHGFNTAQNYYTLCSSKQYLKYIHTPTLILHSIDDPFMDENILPSQEEMSDSITLEVSENGGHVGFIEGTFLNPEYWLEKRILEFLKDS